MERRVSGMALSALLLTGVVGPSPSYTSPPSVFPSATRRAVASTPLEDAQLAEAVSLHDQGKFDQALSKYAVVLAQNPHNVMARYECCMTLYARRSYQECVEACKGGLAYQSDMRYGFFMLLGTSYASLGDPKKALEAYKAGIALRPDDAMLRYNCGITLSKLDRLTEARDEFRAAVRGNPRHASSHLALGETYMKMGHMIPGILALWRFLMLEDGTTRSEIARSRIANALASKASRQGPGAIALYVNPQSNTFDDGDYSTLDFVVATSAALAFDTSQKARELTKSPMDDNRVLFSVLSKMQEDIANTGFLYQYYVPYYAAMARYNYQDEFYYFTGYSQPGNRAQWLEEHADRVRSFLQWSNEYDWSTK
jgi:tetratricopeptide (TPR) repeat protein